MYIHSYTKLHRLQQAQRVCSDRDMCVVLRRTLRLERVFLRLFNTRSRREIGVLKASDHMSCVA